MERCIYATSERVYCDDMTGDMDSQLNASRMHVEYTNNSDPSSNGTGPLAPHTMIL